MYALSEAARLLELPPATLRRWLEGFTVRGVPYQAVIRLSDRNSSDVTWAEFIEAGYLREYRVKGTVSLQRLRRFIDLARESWGVPYPLAHFKPLVGERRDLLIRLKQLQDEAQLDDDLQPVRLVDPETGQLAFSAGFKEFLNKVQFSDGVATSMHPLGSSIPVVIHPDVAFGVPQVHGIRTETIAEAIATGEDHESVAATYGLSIPDVRAAIQWELQLRPRPRSEAA